MSEKTPTKGGRFANSRPAPPSFDPTEGGDETPTPSKNKRTRFDPADGGDETLTPSKKKRSVAQIVESASAKVSPDKIAKPASMVPFRHKWMKKTNSKGVPYAETGMKSDTANTNEEVSKTRKSAKGKAKAIGFSPPLSGFGNMASASSPKTPQKDEEYDSEDEYDGSQGIKEEAYMDAEGKIGTFGPRAMNTIEKARRKLKNEEGVTDPNGRSVGRKLVMWHRPRMMEKLLLHTQYECHKKGIQLPWDDIVHRLSPGSSGPSATQMLNKLRDVLVTEGHMIPPVLGKSGAAKDPTLRGYIRDLEAEIPTTTMAVRWSDDVRDRKESLVVPGLVRGSGKYRKTPKTDRIALPPSDYDNMEPGFRRNRQPAEVTRWAAEQRAMKGSARKIKTEERVARSGSSRKRIKKEYQEDSESEIDPAELDSGDDYDPERKKSSSRRRKMTGDWSGPNPFPSPTPKSGKKFLKRTILSDSENNEHEEEDKKSLIVKLQIPSGGLEDFDSGVSGKKPKNIGYFETPKRLSKKELMMSSKETESMGGAGHGVKKSSSYQGMELHGSLGDYMQAVKDGKDPSLNRTGFKDARSIYRKVLENPAAEALLVEEEAHALKVHRQGLASGQVTVESTVGDDDVGYQAGGDEEDAPYKTAVDHVSGYDNDHNFMQYQQNSSQSFSDTAHHPQSFNSQATSFNSQYHNNYPAHNYAQAQNRYEVQGTGSFAEMDGMMDLDSGAHRQNQDNSMAGPRHVDPDLFVYPDSPDPSDCNDNGSQAEREDSPARWRATAVRNPFSASPSPQAENRPDGDYFMHDVHQEQQSNDGHFEDVDDFANV